MAVKAISNTITMIKVTDGQNGIGISKTEVFYYLSTSNTIQTGGTWATTVPTWVDGRYYWQKIKTTFTNGNSSESTPVCVTGGKGSTGAVGTGVQSIDVEFYLSKSNTSQTGGAWGTTMPTWSNGKYLWTRNKVTYSNPNKIVFTTPICDSSWEAVNEIKVGGRNYFKGYTFDEEVRLNDYNNVGSFTQFRNLTVPMSTFVGEQMTFSFDIKSPNGTTSLATIYNSNNSPRYLIVVKSQTYNVVGTEWQRVVAIFTVIDKGETETSEDTSNKIEIYCSDKTGVLVKNMKLEKGNKATDWTPAPEDIDKDINDAKDAANTAQDTADTNTDRIITSETAIEQLEDSISMLVRGPDGESLMEQTDDGWSFNLSSILSSIEKTTTDVDGLNADVTNAKKNINTLTKSVSDLGIYTDYIKFGIDNGKPCIILGEIDSNFKVLITNTDIRFMEGTTIPASISNQALNIGKAVINEELTQGGFSWIARSNGNYGLIWKG